MKRQFSSINFDSQQEMSQSATNWDHHCSYKLLPYAYEGEHNVITLPHTQLSYSHRRGGFMHDAFSPPNAISIAVIQECYEAACFDTFKLHAGMVLFFDNRQAFNFMSRGEIKVAIISLPSDLCHSFGLNIENYFGHYVEDTDGTLSSLFNTALKSYLDTAHSINEQQVEDAFITLLSSLIQDAEIKDVKLTKGELIALTIRDQVYRHMDGKVNIDAFAKEYKVSDQTLQNAFQSLFGFTPKQFLMRLKLNLVHHDLQKYQPKIATVQTIASKWGFTHMGRFSKIYTELFLVKPSETLKKGKLLDENMISECVSRQEEML